MDQTNTSLKNIKDKLNAVDVSSLQENEANLLMELKEFFEKT